jgi:hypothetical protein
VRPGLCTHGPFALVALACAAIYVVLTSSDMIGMQDDGVVYLLTARHYAPWIAPDAVAAAIASDSAFPPLYPVVLALAGAAQGGIAAHGVMVLCLVLALLAMYAWLLALGIGALTAAGAAALFALCPGTVWLMFNILSEPLYVAFSLATCVIFVRSERRPAATPDASSFGAAALVAAAILTRSAGITFLAPLAVYLWRRHRARGLALLAGAVLPQVIWTIAHPSSSPIGYSAILREAAPYLTRDPGFLLAQAMTLAQGLRENLFLASPWIAAPLVAVALAGAAARAARWHADAIALLCYLALLLIWPYPGEAQRLAWVSVPLLLGNLLWAARWIGDRWGTTAPAITSRLPALIVVAMALAVAPSPALLAERWFSPEAAARPELRHVGAWYMPRAKDAHRYAPMEHALAQAFREFGQRMPAGECTLSIQPRLATYYAGRRSILPPPPERDAAGFEESLRWRACRYVVMVNAVSDRGPVPFYPLDRLGDRLEILERRTVVIGGQELPLAMLGKLGSPSP